MKEKLKISYRGFYEIFRAIETAIVFTRLGTKEQNGFIKSYNHLQSAKFIASHMTINPFNKGKQK